MSLSSLLRCLIVLSLAGAGHSVAAPRVGELLVKEGNGGVPCFTIPEAEEARDGAPDFNAITVSEMGAIPKTALWRMAMPAQRTFPVSYRMCIPYAGRSPVLPQMPAAPLQPGRIYDVVIDARRARAGGRAGAAPRDYRGRFCLVQQAGGALRVRNIGAGGNAKQRPACAPQ